MTDKILIVDDERDFCRLLRDYLVSRDCVVEIRHTIADASARVKSYLPDVVFLDNNLPDGQGWNFALDLVKETPDIFIYFISALSGAVPKLPAGSRFAVIEKPIDLSKIELARTTEYSS